jgi:hypothetical protein
MFGAFRIMFSCPKVWLDNILSAIERWLLCIDF